jgi:hypothetical protein
LCTSLSARFVPSSAGFLPSPTSAPISDLSQRPATAREPEAQKERCWADTSGVQGGGELGADVHVLGRASKAPARRRRPAWRRALSTLLPLLLAIAFFFLAGWTAWRAK